jgi:hypothetical protein
MIKLSHPLVTCLTIVYYPQVSLACVLHHSVDVIHFQGGVSDCAAKEGHAFRGADPTSWAGVSSRYGEAMYNTNLLIVQHNEVYLL